MSNQDVFYRVHFFLVEVTLFVLAGIGALRLIMQEIKSLKPRSRKRKI